MSTYVSSFLGFPISIRMSRSVAIGCPGGRIRESESQIAEALQCNSAPPRCWVVLVVLLLCHTFFVARFSISKSYLFLRLSSCARIFTIRVWRCKWFPTSPRRFDRCWHTLNLRKIIIVSRKNVLLVGLIVSSYPISIWGQLSSCWFLCSASSTFQFLVRGFWRSYFLSKSVDG